MTVYEKSVSCDKTNLIVLREFVSQVLRNHHVSSQDINLLVLAVDEVCTNVMVHSHQCNPVEVVTLKITQENGRFAFEVYDDGKCFNILEHREPSLNQVIKEKKAGGLGLLLVKRIMDAIEMDIKKSGNVYRLIKHTATY
jgi:serine/threonine-protein kinase RsbW